MSEKQRTIKEKVTITGVGLHTGKDCTVSFLPAPENHGFVFKRVDLEGKPTIAALLKNVIDTSRGSKLEENGAQVGTIEHVLAALRGLEIDNALIEIDSCEAPILDGSSRIYVDELLKIGTQEQEAEREYIELKEPLKFTDEEKNVDYLVVPDDKFSLNVQIDYNSSVLLHQFATLDNISDFKNEIANCRTFVFLHELELLLEHNLIKGGDLSNAIVIVDKETTQEELDRIAKVFNQDSVEVVNQGILNNIELQYDNEPARHKLLDLIGDLTLMGKPLKAKVFASKPGHASNVKLGKEILKLVQKAEKVPFVNFDAEPVMDINDIKKILPHRPPFLLVDKIYSIEKDTVIGIKNVSMNEPFFVGHFPEEPVMPGVLIIEAMAQTGGILVLHNVDEPEKYSTYFAKIDKVKFKQKVVPGDTLVFKLQFTGPGRRGLYTMKAEAFVGNKLVTEGEFMAQIVKNK